MPAVTLVLEVRLEGCGTARQRASEAEAILGKLRRHFNVSVADLSPAGPGEVAALGVSAVARTRREAREILDRVAEAVAAHPRAEVLKRLHDEA